MTLTQFFILIVIASIGHLMALFWYHAKKHGLAICRRTIYELSASEAQVKQEIKNSLLIPMHAVLLVIPLSAGYFRNTDLNSFLYTVILTFVWAEIWHYSSHRAMHLRSLHWIHLEHHKSRINTPFTALSFSFTEKLVFDLGMILPLMAVDYFASLNFYGIAAWFIGYLVVNSFSHANFEFRPPGYNRHVGKILTTTTYHALHHSRYTGNYGLATRVLDRLLGTEWDDYEKVYEQVNSQNTPLQKLKQKAD